MPIALAVLVLGAGQALPQRPQVELQAPASAELVCPEHDWRSPRCEAQLPLRVTNHAGTAVELVQVRLSGNGAITTYEYEPRVSIAVGDTWQWTMKIRREGRFTVQLQVRSPTYTAMSSPSTTTVTVTDPERDQARAACRACRGKWGPHGLVGMDGCICRARDAGKRCDDGDQCEGDCLYRRMVVVRKGSTRCRRDGTCTTTLDRMRPVGVCSEWIGDLGCKTPIPRGASRKPLSGGTRLSRFCSD